MNFTDESFGTKGGVDTWTRNLAIYQADLRGASNSGKKDDCAILSDTNDACSSKYGISHAGSTFYNLLSLPTDVPGPDPMANIAGRPFTALERKVYTLSLEPGFVSTITPVKYNEKAAQTTASTSDASQETTATSDDKPSAVMPSGYATPSVKSDGTVVFGVSHTLTVLLILAMLALLVQ